MSVCLFVVFLFVFVCCFSVHSSVCSSVVYLSVPSFSCILCDVF